MSFILNSAIGAVMQQTSAGLHSVAGRCKTEIGTPMREHAERFDAARAALAKVIDASAATIKAFEALGTASGVVENNRAHKACENALVAQKAALAELGDIT